LKEAKNKSFDEAIILNNRGFIAEGSRSNIFLVKDNRIFTPALECGCLDGITRRVIFDLAQKHNLKIQGGNFTPQDLRESDEAFLSNSLIGVMPAVSVDKYPIGKGRVGRITKFFMSKYHLLLKNGG
jgi:branched-subunit amino acid aminotransferase/4-amino-4-deoxychorismate lyase